MAVPIGTVEIQTQRDMLLTDFGKATLKDRYLQPCERYQDLFARVACAYADDAPHARRLYNYISNLWFMPATPVLSNGGTKRGLPISCYLNECEDNLNAILGLWTENANLAAKGGGIGSFWGNLRGIGDAIGSSGRASGIIPFLKVMDSMTLAISQGDLRRGSAAVYLPISHPEIEEFIDMRKPTGGDPNRKALNLNNAVTIPDAFMHALERGDKWPLISPATGATVALIDARGLWAKILTARIETGEPYMIFIDAVQRGKSEVYKALNIDVKTSNLCTEITLATGLDPFGGDRTAVCCLSSLNLETWDFWKDNAEFIPDVMRFLDNVMSDFIERAPPAFARAVYSASRERSVGLGVMGFHSFLQSRNLPFSCATSKSYNLHIFRHIRREADLASKMLAAERGPCPDALAAGFNERFAHKLAVAPTASISIICGGTSPGIEPFVANSYTHKTLSGSFAVRNKYLEYLINERAPDPLAAWLKITSSDGSAAGLDFLSEDEKEVFLTAFELPQRAIVTLAADRTPYICQAQSVNLFLPSDVSKHILHNLHYEAWRIGSKSLYYMRSKSLQRAEKLGHDAEKAHSGAQADAGECLACQ
jgi:ribonucleoside-diphosphate reductase alpha chain